MDMDGVALAGQRSSFFFFILASYIQSINPHKTFLSRLVSLRPLSLALAICEFMLCVPE